MSKYKLNKPLSLILVLTAIVFSNSLFNGFVWDDWNFLVYNETYQEINLKKILLDKANPYEYLPVRDITLAIDTTIWGLKPFGFHLTNLLIYMASLAALFNMAKNMAEWSMEKDKIFIAFWTTIIFALHPLHTEPVNFISARNNLLAGLFLFISGFLYFKWMLEEKRICYLLSIAAFILSLFSKASVIFYPLFILLTFFLLPDRFRHMRGKVFVFFLALMAIDVAAIGMHFVNASSSGAMSQHLIRYGVDDLWLTTAKAMQIPFFYLKMLVLPYCLNTQYIVSFISRGYIVHSVLAGLGMILILYISWILRKNYLLFVLGIAWFFLSLGPVLNIFPTSPVVADRYAFLAIAGLGFAFSSLLKTFVEKDKRYIVIPWIVLLFWGFADINRNADWHSDISLWESSISANPRADRINLAAALWNKGRYEEALTHLKKDRDISGNFAYSLYKGKYLAKKGEYQEAVEFYKKALSEGGDAEKEPHFYLAQAYETTKLHKKALYEYFKIMEVPGMDTTGRYVQLAKDGIERIRKYYTPQLNKLRVQASKEQQSFRAQSSLAFFLHQLGYYDEAAKCYLRTIELNPSSWEVWYNLGLVYVKLEKHTEAVNALKKSLSINPANKDALINIGVTFVNAGSPLKGAEYYERALALCPSCFEPAFNLGRIYFAAGNKEMAKKYFSMAKALAKDNPGMCSAIDNMYLKGLK